MANDLNPEQQEASKTLKGPLLVLAGAGTGKTTVITRRIGNLLASGIAPANILAVTFTNKAAREMRDRLKRLLPNINHDEMTVSTFHSFCCRVLRGHIKHLGYEARFGIADTTDQEGIIKQVIGEMGVQKNEENSARAFQMGISNAKNQMLTPDTTATASSHPWFAMLGQVYGGYQRHLKDMNLVDFDDLLLLTVRLWQEHPNVLKIYRDKYHYILVDEFQDTNMVQAEIVRLIAGTTRNICVVGDDDQSIYGWRGADVSNILDFPNEYPGAKVIKLEQNYRSTNAILKVANRLIANNDKRHDKELWSSKPEGDLIKVVECDSEEDESRMIGKLIQDQHFEHKRRYDEIAILYRSKYQSRMIEQEMRNSRIPYRLVGSRSFYEQREIKDAVAYLRIVQNERDDLGLLRILNVPPRGIGSKTIDLIRQTKDTNSSSMLQAVRLLHTQKQFSSASMESVRDFLYAYDQARKRFAEPADIGIKIEKYLTEMGYLQGLKRIYRNHEDAIQRQENIFELIMAADKFDRQHNGLVGLLDFLEEYALTDDNDRVDDHDEDGAGVTLMTVHAAKGLEFPAVIIAGMEERLFPHERAVKDGNLDEERRLFYVAVTRAKDRLLMTRARTRQRRDTRLGQGQRPSRFLHELPEEFIEFTDQRNALRKATREEASDFLQTLMDRYKSDDD